jgi:hypothetical protein
MNFRRLFVLRFPALLYPYLVGRYLYKPQRYADMG